MLTFLNAFLSSANVSTLLVILSSKCQYVTCYTVVHVSGLSISQWLPCPLAIWNLLFGMAILLNLFKKSLIYIKNNKGPNTDPCGTPFKTDFQFETSPSPTTFCDQTTFRQVASEFDYFAVDYIIYG